MRMRANTIFSGLAKGSLSPADFVKSTTYLIITGTDSQIEPYFNPWDAGLHKIPVNAGLVERIFKWGG